MPHAEECNENPMPHPENASIDMGKRYESGTPEAEWYRERYDRFVQIIAQRREDSPSPSNSPLNYIGGDARYYLSEDEASMFDEAGDQVAYAERGDAVERVAARRAAFMAARGAEGTMPSAPRGARKGKMQNSMPQTPVSVSPKTEVTDIPAKPRRARKSKVVDIEQGNGPNLTVRIKRG